MTQQRRQDAFLDAADRFAVLDRATLIRLLHAVPDPAQAIRYLVEKQLLDQAKAASLHAAYQQAAEAIPEASAQPARRRVPTPPPRPGESSETAPSPPAEPSRQPDASEVDAFDAMIDDILNE